MEKKSYDLAVIGAGPGGYVAAIKGASLGLKTVLIEKQYLGGTCLNCGCIPTKTLLSNASVLHKIKNAEAYGIVTGPVKIHYNKMKERKDAVVSGIRDSLSGLIASHGVEIKMGSASFVSAKELKISGDSKEVIRTEKVIVATGSDTLDIGAFPCDHKKIFNSTSILELTKLPSSIAIIGGGYIGCEFASLFAELGVNVTIIEALDSIVQTQGKEISSFLTQAFTEKGITLKTGAMVQSIDTSGNGVKVHLKEGDPIEADISLVAIGRRFHTDGLSPEKAGLGMTDKGAIEVNERMETNVPGIYAIGDVTGEAMLAHVASHQGIIAAENAAGYSGTMHYNAVPAVIFTDPEIATCGMTLEEAKGKGYDAAIGKFPFQALGKAQAAMETTGFAQVVIEKRTKQILGAQVIGHEASVLIGEMALAIANELTLECVTETIHAHPTLAESWLEAALIANESPIHLPPKKK